MGISDVCSPVSRKGSKVGSGPPLSPGARSMPRGDALEPAEGQEPDPAPREREAKQDQQEQGEPVPTNIHVHNAGTQNFGKNSRPLVIKIYTLSTLSGHPLTDLTFTLRSSWLSGRPGAWFHRSGYLAPHVDQR
jgi:hypothetical protein